MTRNWIIRPAAQAEIDQQADYLAEHASESVAYRFIAAVEETLFTLLDAPELGSPWASNNERLQGIRRQIVSGFPNHLVFYRHAGNALELLHVYHGKQAVEARLNNEAAGDDEH